MLTMGNSKSVRKINFEDMQDMIKDMRTIIINTMEPNMQDCLITRTVLAKHETELLNKLINTNLQVRIVIYGINATDDKIVKKYNQLLTLGFTNVLVYPGGMFEWLLLQDTYGSDHFQTTKTEVDILKYKGKKISNLLLTNY